MRGNAAAPEGPAADRQDEQEKNPGKANPAEGDHGLEPIIVSVCEPVLIGRAAVQLIDGLEGARAGPEDGIISAIRRLTCQARPRPEAKSSSVVLNLLASAVQPTSQPRASTAARKQARPSFHFQPACRPALSRMTAAITVAAQLMTAPARLKEISGAIAVSMAQGRSRLAVERWRRWCVAPSRRRHQKPRVRGQTSPRYWAALPR